MFKSSNQTVRTPQVLFYKIAVTVNNIKSYFFLTYNLHQIWLQK